jgi:hypothetical protein
MAHFHTPAERRDDLACDRDDLAGDRDAAADIRDTTSQDRDADGRRRDADAAHRDTRAGEQRDDLDDGVGRLRRQILDHFAQIENSAVDPADWPDLTPAALTRLRAHAAEQRRLAAVDRAAATRLLADLHEQISRLRVDRHAAADDRRAAARDRQASAQDRHDAAQDRRSSAQDRDGSARDRNQAVIEREQVDPLDRAEPDRTAGRSEQSLVDRAGRAIDESRQRIADARAYLIHTHHTEAPRAPTTGSDHDSARG